LLRRGLAILVQTGLRFLHLGLFLVYNAGGGFDGGTRGPDVGGLGLSGGFDLIVFLARNFFFGDQGLIARQVGLRFGVVGFGFSETGGGSIVVMFGGGDSGFGVSDIGFGARDVGSVFSLGDGHVGLLRGDLAAGLVERGGSLVQRDLEIARV